MRHRRLCRQRHVLVARRHAYEVGCRRRLDGSDRWGGDALVRRGEEGKHPAAAARQSFGDGHAGDAGEHLAAVGRPDPDVAPGGAPAQGGADEGRELARQGADPVQGAAQELDGGVAEGVLKLRIEKEYAVVKRVARDERLRARGRLKSFAERNRIRRFEEQQATQQPARRVIARRASHNHAVAAPRPLVQFGEDRVTVALQSGVLDRRAQASGICSRAIKKLQ